MIDGVIMLAGIIMWNACLVVVVSGSAAGGDHVNNNRGEWPLPFLIQFLSSPYITL